MTLKSKTKSALFHSVTAVGVIMLSFSAAAWAKELCNFYQNGPWGLKYDPAAVWWFPDSLCGFSGVCCTATCLGGGCSYDVITCSSGVQQCQQLIEAICDDSATCT